MPSNTLKKVVEVTDLTLDEVEALWNKAKKQAKKQNQEDNYAYVMSIFKNMLGKDVVGKLGWKEESFNNFIRLRGRVMGNSKSTRILNSINEKVDLFDKEATAFFLDHCFRVIKEPEKAYSIINTYKVMYENEGMRGYTFFNNFSKILDNCVEEPFEDKSILQGYFKKFAKATEFDPVSVKNVISLVRAIDKIYANVFGNKGLTEFVIKNSGFLTPRLDRALDKSLEVQGLNWNDVFN